MIREKSELRRSRWFCNSERAARRSSNGMTALAISLQSVLRPHRASRVETSHCLSAGQPFVSASSSLPLVSRTLASGLLEEGLYFADADSRDPREYFLTFLMRRKYCRSCSSLMGSGDFYRRL